MKFFGGDLGLTNDSSTLAGVEVIGNELSLFELTEIRPEKGQPLKLSEVIGAFAEIVRAHGCSAFMADGWSREAAREHADKVGITIESAPEGRAGKVAAYLATRDALREGVLHLPNNPRLRAQLRAVIAKPVAGGGLVISSPRRGGHGVLVSGLTLAVWQAREACNNTVTFDDDSQWSACIPRMRV
jgi:hypothetical protein